MGVILEISRVTLRQLLGRRRTLLLLLLAVLPILLALVFRAANVTGMRDFTRGSFGAISMTILLPLVAILFGSGAFGAELDDGTIVYLLAKPVPRIWIVLAKAITATLLAIALTAASTALAGFIALSPFGSDGIAATEAQVLAMIVGSACYACLFLTISLFTRRALIIGIGYMLVWEGALSLLLPGIANLSIRQYALGASTAIFKLDITEVPPAAQTAFILASILVLVSVAVATWRLMRFELPGGTD